MSKNKKSTNIFGKIFLVFAIVVAIFFSGYFFLDKVIIPKYFDRYGIYGVSDLVGVVTSLYKNPNESKFVTNPYSQTDLKNAVTKLQAANYHINDDGTIPEEYFVDFKGDGKVELTDREFAAVCESMLESGILSSVLPNLNYINLINISLLEVIVEPDLDFKDEEDNTFTAADVGFIVKIETVDIREQIATQMGTPLYLIEMIIPKTIYFKINYHIDLTQDGAERTNGTIAINGRTSAQSEVLINLLIEFIFPEDERMTLEQFTDTLGDVILKGIDALGSFKFANELGTSGTKNGIVVW